MLGAVIGDIVGSRFEWNNIKTKDFEFFTQNCSFTDDSVLTIAIANALLRSKEDYSDLSDNAIKYLQDFGNTYYYKGYGNHFLRWLKMDNPLPYNSWGNGAAMRVSACGWVGKDLEEVKHISRLVTKISHNHPEGIKGAEATAIAIFLARNGCTIAEIRDFIMEKYYDINFTLDEIRPDYFFNESCQGTVPQALVAFFESTDFEDAIRNAISIGGDSDTIASITGSIAEAYYGIPEEIKAEGLSFLTEDLKDIVNEFYEKISK